MKEFEKLKAEYDATPIPQELNDRIQQGMRQGRRRRVLRICRLSGGGGVRIERLSPGGRRRRGPPCVGPPVSSAHRPGI